MIHTTLLFVLFFIGHAVAQVVYRYEPCVPNDKYVQYDAGSALVQINANGVGGTINWNFCAQQEQALRYVKRIRIDFTESTGAASTLASHSVDICNGNGNDCLAQLSRSSYPSCVTGQKKLDWLRVPHNETTSTILLLENNDKAIAKFCAV